MITDHHLLLCNVHHPKPHLQKTKTITRAFRSIDLPSLRTDISQGLGDPDENLSVTDLKDINYKLIKNDPPICRDLIKSLEILGIWSNP